MLWKLYIYDVICDVVQTLCGIIKVDDKLLKLNLEWLTVESIVLFLGNELLKSVS